MAFSFLRNQEKEIKVAARDVVVLDYLLTIDKDISSYRGIYIFISKLQNQGLKNVQRESLHETFDRLVKRNGGKTFYMNNDDILAVFHKRGNDEIQACMVKLKFLFGDDPFLKNANDLESAGLVKFFNNLSRDVVDIRGTVRASMQEGFSEREKDKEKKAQERLPDSVAHTVKKVREDLTPAMLAKAEQVLSRTDFSSMIRRQSVCAVIGKAPPQILFDEAFVSIADLRDMLFADVALTSNPWLFQHLTQTLDKRVLVTVAQHDDGSFISNYSLNLNVDTVLSDQFLAFDEHINILYRPSIILELQLVDILSDIRAFNLARTFAQYRGYKICIDGVTVDRLRYVNREFLDCDLLKVIWHPTLIDVINEDKHFIDHLNKPERSKMIICRVDDPQAVEIGNAVGINLYQGRYIQRMLAAQPKKTIYKV